MPLFMVFIQIFSEVYNITPSTGSLLGGTHLTIEGRYFDKTTGPPIVQIAGEYFRLCP